MKDLSYYMGLPYAFVLTGNRRDGWLGKVQELPGCMSQGDTIKELHDNIKEAMELWLEVALEDGDPIPEPSEASTRRPPIIAKGPHRPLRDLPPRP